MAVAARINQLGGAPDFNPATLTGRSASEYQVGGDLLEMIRENLIAERIAVDHYRELIRYFGDTDPVTRVMLEKILSVEEEHASDLQDLMATHRSTERSGGSGRGKSTGRPTTHKGAGGRASASRSPAQRIASAKKAAMRKRRAPP
jgi:bacterioferritin